MVSKRLAIGLIFVAHRDDVRVHGRARDGVPAAQNRLHYTIMFEMRFGEPTEIAELRAAEWLHSRRVAPKLAAVIPLEYERQA